MNHALMQNPKTELGKEQSEYKHDDVQIETISHVTESEDHVDGKHYLNTNTQILQNITLTSWNQE